MTTIAVAVYRMPNWNSCGGRLLIGEDDSLRDHEEEICRVTAQFMGHVLDPRFKKLIETLKVLASTEAKTWTDQPVYM